MTATLDRPPVVPPPPAAARRGRLRRTDSAGPLAYVLLTLTTVVFVAPCDALFDKSLSNLQEVAARRGNVLLISDAKGVKEAGETPAYTVEMPECDPFIAPILYALPVQLLAYHIAVEKGTDVDQPRNLAKSVTVE